MRVAITRAEPEALNTAQRVRALGAEAIVAPLLRIEPRAFDTEVAGVQALLFTSTNGVRAFAEGSTLRALPVLTVGDATADAARSVGFADVRSADGDVNALAALALAALSPKQGAIIHFAGTHVAGDLVGALRAAGFEAQRRTVYEAVAVSELPAALSDPSDAILFHSARAAEIFGGFGAPHANQMHAVCLSAAVAKAAIGSPDALIAWKNLIVAPRPREDALLHALLNR